MPRTKTRTRTYTKQQIEHAAVTCSMLAADAACGLPTRSGAHGDLVRAAYKAADTARCRADLNFDADTAVALAYAEAEAWLRTGWLP